MRHTEALRYLGCLTFGYILLLTLSYGESGIQPIFTIIVGLCIWLIAKNFKFVYDKFGYGKTFLGLLILGGVIRFAWAILIPTIPVSDFQYYSDSAFAFSKGVPILSKNMGFTLLLSLGYRLYPNILAAKIINAMASTLSILLVYRIGSKFINPQTGLVATFVFAIFPSEIFMVSVLGTEIIGTTIGLVVLLFLLSIDKQSLRSTLLYIFLAGLFFGLELTVRSSFIFFLPAIIIYIFLIAIYTIKRKLEVLGIFMVGITAGIGLLVISYSVTTGHFTFEPIKTQDAFPILSGTNVDSIGGWSQSDADLYFSWPSNERDVLAIKEAFNRILSNPKDFLELIPKKMAKLMAANDYSSLWSLQAIDWNNNPLETGTFINLSSTWFASHDVLFIRISDLLLQSTYIAVWFFAFIAFKDQKNGLFSTIVLAVILFTLVPHFILEVQGRYHHYIMPLIILFSSIGIIGRQQIAEVKSKKFT